MEEEEEEEEEDDDEIQGNNQHSNQSTGEDSATDLIENHVSSAIKQAMQKQKPWDFVRHA